MNLLNNPNKIFHLLYKKEVIAQSSFKLSLLFCILGKTTSEKSKTAKSICARLFIGEKGYTDVSA